jgi:TonB family protein
LNDRSELEGKFVMIAQGKDAIRVRRCAEARSKHLTGIGIALLEVNPKTGHVIGSRMQQSTGYQLLDDAALNAFRQRRVKPGTVTRVHIPIRFLMRGIVPLVYE